MLVMRTLASIGGDPSNVPETFFNSTVLLFVVLVLGYKLSGFETILHKFFLLFYPDCVQAHSSHVIFALLL